MRTSTRESLQNVPALLCGHMARAELGRQLLLFCIRHLRNLLLAKVSCWVICLLHLILGLTWHSRCPHMRINLSPFTKDFRVWAQLLRNCAIYWGLPAGSLLFLTSLGDSRWRINSRYVDELCELTVAVLGLAWASNGTFLVSPVSAVSSTRAGHTYLVRGLTMIKKVVPLGWDSSIALRLSWPLQLSQKWITWGHNFFLWGISVRAIPLYHNSDQSQLPCCQHRAIQEYLKQPGEWEFCV